MSKKNMSSSTERSVVIDRNPKGDGSMSFSGEAGPKIAVFRTQRGELAKYAASLRARLNQRELAMWGELKGLGDWYSKTVIPPYIVDFLHAPTSTIVEIDGDHDKTAMLAAKGFTIIRFSGDEVKRSLSSVMNRLSAIMKYRLTIHRATPLPLRLPPAPVVAEQKGKQELGAKCWNGREYIRTKDKPDVASARIPPRANASAPSPIVYETPQHSAYPAHP